MGTKWQNRLVGLLVLSALGVIFVPLILSPSSDVMSVNPELSVIHSDPVVIESMILASTLPSVELQENASTDMSPSPKLELFALQIGSYDDEANAERQVALLKKSGFPAFIRIEENIRKVLVGPQTGIAHVEKVRLKLRSSLNYRSLVVAYDPKAGDYP
jgi:cell division septation protein DedD